MITRRRFLTGAGGLAFAGLAFSVLGKTGAQSKLNLVKGYGPLVPDSKKFLDLPKGFSYRVISELNDLMSDGFHVPDRADGMGCIPIGDNRVALIRNHELKPSHLAKQASSIQQHKTPLAYDQTADGVALPGGTSTLIYNLKTQKVENEFLSLVGTIRNCSGGITPWGTWLTCEESVDRGNSKIQQDHGYIFEVPANATTLIDAKPLKAMGRFNHEAACVDPRTGIVYLTEDRGDSLLYRFIPKVNGELAKGGKLQALVIKALPKFDTRNWDAPRMKLNQWFDVEWVDIRDPESPNDDLRKQGYSKGATLFARGEGIHWADNELYFCCTNGGQKQLGQVMRLQPFYQHDSELGLKQDRIQLFLESDDESLYNFGDNLTVAPNGHLVVCEDQYTDYVENHLRGITPQGEIYNIAKLQAQTELAGACFSPDGTVLFVNAYAPTRTIAIEGPWHTLV